MKNIDFLPDIYRQQRVQRSARQWWCLVAGIFSLALLAAASSQWFLRRGIQRELAQVEPKYAEALQRNVQLELIRQEIARAEEVASLYAYVDHPWPRTQLLAGLIRPLPASIALSEIIIGTETLPQSAPLTPASGRPSGPQEGPSPAARDLTTLRQECDLRQAIVSITGTALLLNELHAYVDQLGKSPLIAAAHLKGVESSSGNMGEARFHIHVVVRPGYGQPGGPAIESPATPSANAPSTHQVSRALLPGSEP